MAQLIHVVLNCITDLRQQDGAAIYAVNLAEALANLESVRVSLLVGRGQRKYLAAESQVEVVELLLPPQPSVLQLVGQLYIWRVVRGLRPDIYHIPNSLPFLLKPCASVITIHDLTDLRMRKYGRARTLYRRAVNYWAARYADCLMTVSENSRRDISGLLRVSPEKVQVVYPGVRSIFRPLPKADCEEFVRKKYGFGFSFVLGVGGWQRNKNIPALIEAMRELWGCGCQHGLVILGNGTQLRAEWVTRSRREGFSDRLALVGYVPEENLPHFYNAAELVVYPTLYEGFGLPALESMACGKAPVVFRTSSLPEVVSDGAFLVDRIDSTALAESMERALQDSELRQVVGARALRRSQSFRWEHTAVQVASLYRALLQSRSDTPSSIARMRTD